MAIDKKMSVREAARNRIPLSGADAQALEGALQQADSDCKKLRAEVSDLRAQLAQRDEDAELGRMVRKIVETTGYLHIDRDKYHVNTMFGADHTTAYNIVDALRAAFGKAHE